MLSETVYHTPSDVDSACSLLDDHEEAVVLAGGQSLGLLTKEGIVSPEVVVDITNISEIDGIERDGGELRIGALTTHRTIESSETVAETVPVLAEAAETIADVQIRNAGTIGGVAAYADPTADYPPVLLALDATIVAKSTSGTTEYPATDAFVGYYESALAPDELVTSVRIPIPEDSVGMAFEKLAFRENDRAVVNVCAVLDTDGTTCTDAALAVGSVSDTAVRVTAVSDLVGTELSDSDIDAVAEAIRDELPVSEDPAVSSEYKSAMVENLSVDALQTARDRAQTEGTA